MATGPQAQRAADLHADDLSAYPNVVGIGTRPVIEEPSATGGDAYAVAVYVSRKVPADQLDARQRLPDHVEVAEPGGVERVPVIVVAIGAIEPEAGTEPAQEHGYTTE
jgi:hypothetical protein